MLCSFLKISIPPLPPFPHGLFFLAADDFDLCLRSIIPDHLDFNDSCIGRSLTAGYILLGKKHKNRSPPPPLPPGLFCADLDRKKCCI